VVVVEGKGGVEDEQNCGQQYRGIDGDRNAARVGTGF